MFNYRNVYTVQSRDRQFHVFHIDQLTVGGEKPQFRSYADGQVYLFTANQTFRLIRNEEEAKRFGYAYGEETWHLEERKHRLALAEAVKYDEPESEEEFELSHCPINETYYHALACPIARPTYDDNLEPAVIYDAEYDKIPLDDEALLKDASASAKAHYSAYKTHNIDGKPLGWCYSLSDQDQFPSPEAEEDQIIREIIDGEGGRPIGIDALYECIVDNENYLATPHPKNPSLAQRYIRICNEQIMARINTPEHPQPETVTARPIAYSAKAQIYEWLYVNDRPRWELP